MYYATFTSKWKPEDRIWVSFGYVWSSDVSDPVVNAKNFCDWWNNEVCSCWVGYRRHKRSQRVYFVQKETKIVLTPR